MKQDAHCMVILNDFQGFARKNVRGSLGWCHMMISCLSFVSGLNFCNCSETKGGVVSWGCSYVFFGGREEKGKGKKILMILQVANQSTQNGWLPNVYFWYDEYPIIFEPRGSY